MIAEEIPGELVEILDRRAGREHSRDGSVLRTLAEILTRHEDIVRRRVLRETQ